jgi:hypothetical protein
MIPHFEPPVCAEMIRDGGSLAMSFTSEENHFWLLFPLIQDDAGKRFGYGTPLVVNRTLGIERPLTWTEAILWLERGATEFSDKSDQKWARIMIKVATMEGGLPDELSPNIGGGSISKKAEQAASSNH